MPKWRRKPPCSARTSHPCRCGELRQVERLGGMRSQKIARPADGLGQRVDPARMQPDRLRQPIARLPEQSVQQRLAPIGGRKRWQAAPAAQTFGEVGELDDICPRSRAPCGADSSTEGSNSTGRTARPDSAAARCSTRRRSSSRISWAQSSQTMRVGKVGDSSDAARSGAVATLSGGEDLRRPGERQLHQEEAIEAAGIDCHRTAIGNVVDGEAVECRAIMQREELSRSPGLRLQPVRTEDPAYLFSGVIDIVRRNTAIGGEARRSGPSPDYDQLLHLQAWRTSSVAII